MITSDTGTRIITDPYVTGDELSYGEIKESADIVTISHDHSDHNNISAVRGNPEVVRGTAKAKGIEFKGIPTYHDDAGGKSRGNNTIFCFEVDGISVCHLLVHAVFSVSNSVASQKLEPLRSLLQKLRTEYVS